MQNSYCPWTWNEWIANSEKLYVRVNAYLNWIKCALKKGYQYWRHEYFERMLGFTFFSVILLLTEMWVYFQQQLQSVEALFCCSDVPQFLHVNDRSTFFFSILFWNNLCKNSCFLVALFGILLFGKNKNPF